MKEIGTSDQPAAQSGALSGMDNEQLEHLFEPFFSTKLKSGKNFGLGLFHVKKIMNAHRGKVEVTSEAGRGTVVTLVFPLTFSDPNGLL